MGPLGHLGFTVGGAQLLNAAPRVRLDLRVIAFAAVLPDLVDKPLYVVGVGDGRYVGHTLLFAFLFAGALSTMNRVYGLSALFGAVMHLALDYSSVPWLYPFVNYEFTVEFALVDMGARLATVVDTVGAGYHSPYIRSTELLGMIILIGLLCHLCWRHFAGRRSSSLSKGKGSLGE